LIGVTSPPYFESVGGDNNKEQHPEYKGKGSWNVLKDYGSSERQIGNLKD